MKLNTFLGLKGHGEWGHINLETLGDGLVERWDQSAWIFHVCHGKQKAML